MSFRIIRNDITKVKADAIVNTANPMPVYASGTDRAVYEAAGAEKLLLERKKIGEIHPGEAAVTDAFALDAKYIIHTVGPVWEGGGAGELDTLASCYRKALLLARQLMCESIAFPLISTGVYGFPKDRALDVALGVFSEFLKEADMEILLVVFDRTAFRLSEKLVDEVDQYIDDHYVSLLHEEEYSSPTASFSDFYETGALPSGQVFQREEAVRREKALRRHRIKAPKQAAKPASSSAPKLSDVVDHVGENFREMLLRLIDERGLSDTQVYKKANIDRKLFSKIRCNADYTPKKRTALALAVALELNIDETVDLISRAGIAFSPGSKFDLIVRYCIEHQMYDIFEINALLFKYDQPLLV